MGIPEITFNINIHNNSLLVKGDIPDGFETFEVLGKFIEALSKLNKELEIVILFDMQMVPFMFILYLNKMQKTLLQDNIELQFTVVSRDNELKEFLEGFKDSTNLMQSQGINPFQDIMSTMGAGNTELDNITIPDALKENMPDDIRKHIDDINKMGKFEDKANEKLPESQDPPDIQDLHDLNIEELNKIKFIYQA